MLHKLTLTFVLLGIITISLLLCCVLFSQHADFSNSVYIVSIFYTYHFAST
uniref:Uncharacterized protein n=1 Tax=Arundo donax TaxID=35708 RepID=A0A0A8Z0G9_ARUDO